jgi:hypothetical protein
MTIANGLPTTLLSGSTLVIQTGSEQRPAFDHAAEAAARQQSWPARAGALADPGQLASELTSRMDGFLRRAGEAAREQAPSAGAQGTTERSALDDRQLDRVIDSMNRSFEFAVQTQLVVRGATQTTGSANTVLKGQ